ncbi:MAG: ImmA/IrrE family metallo-endopeptidase [Oscillospiraceae bacterium]|nr:ImmA/IrrE family metallo-endopeptidase [Oscillospiraceae bacterium]
MENLVVRAEELGHTVLWYPFRRAEGLSLRLEDGSCVIGLDPRRIRSRADARVKLAHEIGHCETGAFYTRADDRTAVRRCEARADRWAFRQLVPYRALCDAITHGCRTPWELAERFCVTQAFLEQALAFYRETRSLPQSGTMMEDT